MASALPSSHERPTGLGYALLRHIVVELMNTDLSHPAPLDLLECLVDLGVVAAVDAELDSRITVHHMLCFLAHTPGKLSLEGFTRLLLFIVGKAGANINQMAHVEGAKPLHCVQVWVAHCIV